MCSGGSRSPAPAPPPPPPPIIPEAPQLPEQPASRTIGKAGSTDRKRRAAASGQGSGTILTSSRGVTQQGQTATKTLLGE